ncbi:unnamed protein product [Effrenium voratum]|uniref:Uncharacterized protein n=1 Tax=Effrenium voratum TaxID=2562239 RepID=A0AA36J8F1_9DINO|nr:unnamed protein product [Effrenium voratum]CAJ1461674.1 unnamed protein product [Effrenium voratum]
MHAFATEEAKRFQQRMAFHCSAVVAFTCAVYLMGLLRPVLEPFFWALFLVTALEPLTRPVGPGVVKALDSSGLSRLNWAVLAVSV